MVAQHCHRSGKLEALASMPIQRDSLVAFARDHLTSTAPGKHNCQHSKPPPKQPFTSACPTAPPSSTVTPLCGPMSSRHSAPAQPPTAPSPFSEPCPSGGWANTVPLASTPAKHIYFANDQFSRPLHRRNRLRLRRRRCHRSPDHRCLIAFVANFVEAPHSPPHSHSRPSSSIEPSSRGSRGSNRNPERMRSYQPRIAKNEPSWVHSPKKDPLLLRRRGEGEEAPSAFPLVCFQLLDSRFQRLCLPKPTFCLN